MHIFTTVLFLFPLEYLLTTAHFLPIDNNSDLWQQFIIDILLPELNSKEVILFSKFTTENELLLNKILVRDKPIQLNKFSLKWHKSIIITFENYQDLTQTILHISKTKWNPRANFTLLNISQDSAVDVKEIFRFLWDNYFVINVVIILKNDTRFEIYTWYPYSPECNCGNNVVVKKMIYPEIKIEAQHNNGSRQILLFPNKVPKTYTKCKIRLAPFHAVPYVFRDNSTKGLDITFLDTVAERLNLSNILMDTTKFHHYGYLLADGNLTDLFKLLKQRKVDLVFIQILGNRSYEDHFDELYPHLDDAFSWWAPSALRANSWNSILTIFDLSIWGMVVLILIVTPFVWRLSNKTYTNGRENSYYLDFWICLLDVWRTILTSGLPNVPNLLKFRVFFLFWLLYCINIDTAYQTKLISVLTSPHFEKQISNTQEMVEANIKFGFYPTIGEAFTDKSNPVSVKIINNFESCRLTLECVNRTAFKRDFAVIKSQRQVKFYIPTWYSFPSGYPRLFMFPVKVFSFFYLMMTIQGFPMREQYNNLIMRFWANGLYSKWEADILKKHIKQKDTESNLKKLAFADLAIVFGFLGIGLFFALLRFGYELYSKVK